MSVDLEAFTLSYIRTLLWSSLDDDENPEAFSVENLTESAKKRAQDDCAAFIKQARQFIEAPQAPDPLEFAHDFALTRNRHGAGFWDDPKDYGPKDEAAQLTQIAQAFGEVYPFINDEHQIELN